MFYQKKENPVLQGGVHEKCRFFLKSQLFELGFDLPAEGGGGLVLGDSGFEEVLLFSKVDGFAHPREGVFRFVLCLEANALEAAVCNIVRIFSKHGGGKAQDPLKWQKSA